MKAKQYNNTLTLAANYAAADKSDPFAYARIITHINSGICDDKLVGTNDLLDCRYKAEPYQETRKLPPSPLHPEGQEYQVTCYRNLQRP